MTFGKRIHAPAKRNQFRAALNSQDFQSAHLEALQALFIWQDIPVSTRQRTRDRLTSRA